jgi:hypothetical protein
MDYAGVVGSENGAGGKQCGDAEDKQFHYGLTPEGWLPGFGSTLTVISHP